MQTQFEVVEETEEVMHVMPKQDLTEHEASADCQCGPERHREPEGVIFRHHSLDGREVG